MDYTVLGLGLGWAPIKQDLADSLQSAALKCVAEWVVGLLTKLTDITDGLWNNYSDNGKQIVLTVQNTRHCPLTDSEATLINIVMPDGKLHEMLIWWSSVLLQLYPDIHCMPLWQLLHQVLTPCRHAADHLDRKHKKALVWGSMAALPPSLSMKKVVV